MIQLNGTSERPCPVCQSHVGNVIYVQDFGKSQIIPIMGYSVTHCTNCGMIYADNLPTQAAINDYYSKLSRYDHAHREGKQHDSDIIRLNSLAEYISGIVRIESTILDVGCSTADLLAILKLKGYINLVGMDPSATSAEFAMKRHGIKVTTGVMKPRPNEYERFDVVILSNVLEHIIEHKEFMESVLSWLKPNGLIITEVPDASKFHLSRNSPFQEFSVEHVNFFTPITLKNFMNQFGLNEIAPPYQTFHSIGPNLYAPIVDQSFQYTSKYSQLQSDKNGISFLKEYINICQESIKYEEKIIQDLLDSKTFFYIWGVGTMTLRLLQNTPLKSANIAAFVDSNPKYSGMMLNGKEIVAPEQLVFRDNLPILISSWIFQNEIENQIKNQLSLRNQIIKLRNDENH